MEARPTRYSSTYTRSSADWASDRSALLGGLAFLDGSARATWGEDGLRAWFQEHMVRTGCMAEPLLVREPPAGVLVLGSGAHGLPEILVAARIRVLAALRGLIASPVDDRFPAAAIFAGRVMRARVGAVSQWVARPEPTAPLSGIVLSLFAADILANREIYDRALCLCNVCNRLMFCEGRRRNACPDHDEQVSGFRHNVTVPLARAVG